jgi:transposase
MRLPREERQQLVAMLAGEEMSTRAIARIVGVSNFTVWKDIAAERGVSDLNT